MSRPPAEAQRGTCPSGDGSLRWPCPAHPPEAQAVAWYTDDHLTDKSATTYNPVVRDRWIAKGWPVTPLYAAPPSAPVGAYTYASTQATKCAGCDEHKHTPLRIDAMGGYVCLTCIDQKLGSLLGEFGHTPSEPVGVDEAMVFRLAAWMAKHGGHDDPHLLIWEGSPPEPWGEVWRRYEDDARAALTAALAGQQPAAVDGGVAQRAAKALLDARSHIGACRPDDEDEDDQAWWDELTELAAALAGHDQETEK